jgi:hypothetical protein
MEHTGDTLNRSMFKEMFFDIPHAAALVGLSESRFRRILKRRNTRTFRIGRKVFILRAEFEELKADLQSMNEF